MQPMMNSQQHPTTKVKAADYIRQFYIKADFNATVRRWMDYQTFNELTSTGSLNELSYTSVHRYLQTIKEYAFFVTRRPITFEVTKGMTTAATDGRTLYIGTDVTPDNLDSHIGLVFHEAHHIEYSNFDVIKNNQEEFKADPLLKDMNNIVEDKWIDDKAIANEPSFIPMYHAMDYKLFFGPEPTTMLLAMQIKEEPTDVDYANMLLFVYNPKFSTGLSVVPHYKGLDDVVRLLDVENISRLQDSYDCHDLAIKLLEEIRKHAPRNTDYKKGQGQVYVVIEGNGMPSSAHNEEPVEIPHGATVIVIKQEDIDKFREGIKELQSHDQEKTDDSKDKSTKVLDTRGEDTSPEKEKLSDDVKAAVEIIKKSKTMFNSTDSEITLIETQSLPLIKKLYGSYRTSPAAKEVVEGIALGKKLLKKLKTRQEVRVYERIRQPRGLIDKRLISEFGYRDNPQNFKNVVIDHPKQGAIVMSIDVSSSMAGSEFNNAIKNAVAILYAAYHVKNVDAMLELRTDSMCHVVYDSRKHHFQTSIRPLQALSACGGTSEGEVFESRRKDYVTFATNSARKLFVNFSDGLISYRTKSGQSHIEHTKAQMDYLRKNGFDIVSFFINYHSEQVPSEFSQKYGRAALHLGETELAKVAKQLNAFFEREPLHA